MHYLLKKWIKSKQIQDSTLCKQDLTKTSANTKFDFQQKWSQLLKKYQCNSIPFDLYNTVDYFWYQGKKRFEWQELKGKNFNFLSSVFSKFMLLTVRIAKKSTEHPFWECAVTIASFY